MRENICVKISAAAVIAGIIAGAVSAWLAEDEARQICGEWLSDFYYGDELYGKAFFSGPFFVVLTIILGFFILGYLFVFPAAFCFAYSGGFVAASAFCSSGVSAVWDILPRLPSFAVTALLLCPSAASSFRFSFGLSSGFSSEELSVRTGRQIVLCVFLCGLSLLTVFFDGAVMPAILAFF